MMSGKSNSKGCVDSARRRSSESPTQTGIPTLINVQCFRDTVPDRHRENFKDFSCFQMSISSSESSNNCQSWATAQDLEHYVEYKENQAMN